MYNGSETNNPDVHFADCITLLSKQCMASLFNADIRAWCAMNGTNYQTVTKKIDEYKVVGKWNLTVPEQLEQTYQAPSAMPAVEQNLIPQKDDPSSF